MSFPIPATAVWRSISACIVGLVMLAAAGAPLSAQTDLELPDGMTHVVSVEGIHEYQLENGLRVLLFPDPSKDMATVNITYLVGSMHEGYGETGMAHLLEHLLFKGSTNHPNIPDELTAHGARPNGTTWFDRTNYFESFSATEENLEWALDLEADRMVNSFVRKSDLDSEMSVVRNEFEIGENNPMGILEERVYATSYIWHNYGNTTIGARSDIEEVPIDRLKAFYKTWYRPENAILVVAGKFDPVKTVALIDEKFAPIENPETPLPPVYTREPAQDGERTVTLRRVGDIQGVIAGYHIPSGAHPDYPALQVLSHVLGSTPSGRLHKELVETKMATEVSSGADRFKDPALFVLRAEVDKNKDVYAVQKVVLEQAEDIVANPPTDEEVDRAKNALMRRWQQRQRNTSWAAIGLSEWASMGDWRLQYLHRDRLKEVTAADVARVAETYLQSTNRTVGLYIPTDAAERVEIPDTPDLDTMLASYTGGEGMALGEEFDSSPDNIESLLQRSVLANGLNVMLLPKKTRGETVNLSLSLHMGTKESLAGKSEVGRLTGEMLDRGTSSRTRQQIRDEIDALQGSMRIGGGATGVSASIEVTRENLDPMIDILVDCLRNPIFDAEEFAQLKEERSSNLEEQKSSPRSAARTSLNRHLYPYDSDDVRYSMTPEEAIAELEGITADDLMRFHADFYGATFGELSVVGDFDADAIGTLIEQKLADWQTKMPYERIVTEFQDRPAMVDRIQIPDKESAAMSAGVRVDMNDEDALYPASQLGGFMMGGGFLNSRLATRIRQEEGISYSVWAWTWAPDAGNNAGFGAFAMYAPQNDARLMEAFADELRKSNEVPFTADEVAEAKSGWLQQQKVSRSNDRELAGRLNDLASKGRTLQWDKKLEAKIAEVTPEQVTAALKKIIVPGKVSIFRAGDFKKGDATAADAPESSSSSSLVR